MGRRLEKIIWSQYNKELVRGAITFWIDQEALNNWFRCTTGPGFQKIYSDLAILAVLVLKKRLQLTLRSAEGFANSVFELITLELPVPNYTTLSRRASSLDVHLQRKCRGSQPIHVVIDSTGLKVYVEGDAKRPIFKELFPTVREPFLNGMATPRLHKTKEISILPNQRPWEFDMESK